MKIIYLHQYFNTPEMSGGTRSYEMARRLVQFGHEVHMVTSYRNPGGVNEGKWYETCEAGIRVHWLPVAYNNKFNYGDRVKAFMKFAVCSGPKAASLPGDVVFATSTPLTIAVPGIYISKAKKIPMVLEVRDLWPELPIAVGAISDPVSIWGTQRLERLAYHSSTRVVALSPGMRSGVIKAGYPKEKTVVIPNSCDLALFNASEESATAFRMRYQWLGSRPLIVYTGTLGVINGVSYLAELAKVVQGIDSEVRFLIVGAGKEETTVREKARELGVLEQNLFMLPEVKKSEMPTILRAADIATSLFVNIKEMWNNSANKFFDALASGTAVAINYEGWQARLLMDSGAGIVLDPTDVSNAAEVLVEKARNKEWLKKAGMSARKLACEEFSRDSLAKRLEEILITAVQERGSRALSN